MGRFSIVRDDGLRDAIAGQSFESYAAAYAVLERYHGDLCCSDEREYYRIEEESGGAEPADGQLHPCLPGSGQSEQPPCG
jgi:hypothetical protein